MLTIFVQFTVNQIKHSLEHCIGFLFLCVSYFLQSYIIHSVLLKCYLTLQVKDRNAERDLSPLVTKHSSLACACGYLRDMQITSRTTFTRDLRRRKFPDPIFVAMEDFPAKCNSNFILGTILSIVHPLHTGVTFSLPFVPAVSAMYVNVFPIVPKTI